MSGHGEKLTRKQEVAIAALLTSDTAETAAEAAGIAPSTLRRWLKRDDFQAAYRQAKSAALADAVQRLRRSLPKAIETLERNLVTGNAGAEVRAALGLVDRAFRGHELTEMEERLARLEAQAAEMQAQGAADKNRAA